MDNKQSEHLKKKTMVPQTFPGYYFRNSEAPQTTIAKGKPYPRIESRKQSYKHKVSSHTQST
jgi:hypothetical protein